MIDADFCRALPKCDLHIHLNGSFRRETINECADEKHVPHPSFPRMNESIEVIYSKYAFPFSSSIFSFSYYLYISIFFSFFFFFFFFFCFLLFHLLFLFFYI